MIELIAEVIGIVVGALQIWAAVRKAQKMISRDRARRKAKPKD